MPEIESIVRSLEDASISEDLEPSRCLLLFAAYGQGDPTPSIGINQVAAFKVPCFLCVIFLESTHLRRKNNSLLLHCWHWNERVHVDINLVVEIQRVDHGNVLLCRE